MTVTRRRFLAISGCFAAKPALAQHSKWQGVAFGANVSITLSGPESETRNAITKARGLIAETERIFSLYDPASELSQLNKKGTLQPSPTFHSLMKLSDVAHRATGGLFDPTVQPLWQAISEGNDTSKALQLVGWDKLSFDADRVELKPGQALTFNGIAQGYATDLVSELLAELPT